MKLFALMLIAGLSAYAQHGHGGGIGHAGGGSLGPSSPVQGVHSQGANAEGNRARSMDARSASQQSPDTILERNTKLSSKLDTFLPSGTTAQQACSGFKNLGECVSAIHVSHNLGIPFEDLKGKVAGATSEKLGKAIHDLKPDVDAKKEVKKAKKQAKNDLGEAVEPEH